MARNVLSNLFRPAMPTEHPQPADRPSWIRPDWPEMLRNSVVVHHYASGPGVISPEGILQIPYQSNGETKANSQPIGAVSGVVFVLSTEQGAKADLFALVQPNAKVRIAEPTYMGTFDLSSDQTSSFYKKTETTLKNIGVSVSTIQGPGGKTEIT
jgi:hypothetical protein